MRKSILIIIMLLLILITSCKTISGTEDESPVIVVEEFKTPIEKLLDGPLSEYKGLNGTELYNALMTTVFTEDIRFVTHTTYSNGDEVVSTVVRSDGNVHEVYKKNNEEEYIKIYLTDEKKSYEYEVGSKSGNIIKYDDGYIGYDRGFYPLERIDNRKLLKSEIIMHNERTTYYFERVFELENGTGLIRYWYDIETKILMESDIYNNGTLVSKSEVVEFDDNFNIPLNQFDIPQYIEFLKPSEVVR